MGYRMKKRGLFFITLMCSICIICLTGCKNDNDDKIKVNTNVNVDTGNVSVSDVNVKIN